jgi:hypothetical protein
MELENCISYRKNCFDYSLEYTKSNGDGSVKGYGFSNYYIITGNGTGSGFSEYDMFYKNTESGDGDGRGGGRFESGDGFGFGRA